MAHTIPGQLRERFGERYRVWRGETAAAVMRERYHPLVIARRHLEIYREVLEGKK